MATEKAIIRCLEFVCAAYDREPDIKVMRVWLDILSDGEVTDEALDQATRAHIKAGSPYFPKVGEIYKAAQRKSATDAEDNTPRRMFWRAMELQGAYFRGEITEDQMVQDTAWKWYENASNWRDPGIRPVEFDSALLEEAVV